MIAKRYERTTGNADPRQRAGAAAESQMAFYLHRAFDQDPETRVLHGLRLEDPGQPEQDGFPGACQIDQLGRASLGRVHRREQIGNGRGASSARRLGPGRVEPHIYELEGSESYSVRVDLQQAPGSAGCAPATEIGYFAAFAPFSARAVPCADPAQRIREDSLDRAGGTAIGVIGLAIWRIAASWHRTRERQRRHGTRHG